MSPTAAIEAILSETDPKKIASTFRQHAKQPGFSAAYFQQVLSSFGSDANQASRLAGHWPHLLKHGDDPALAYRTKGAADRLAGKWLDSAKAFVKSGSLAALESDKLSFQVGAVDSYARAGRLSLAIALGKKLVKGLEALGESGLAGRVRLNVGNALLWQDRYREARTWLRKALGDLAAGGFEVEAIYARLGLSTAELFGGSPAEAQMLGQVARDQAREAGLEHTALLAEINVAQAALLQGKADEALFDFLRLRNALADSPHDLARIWEFLGDTYLHLNLWQEADNAYQEALSRRRELPALNIASACMGVGRAAHHLGDKEASQKALANAARRFGAAGNEIWKAAAQTWLGYALLANEASSHAHKLALQAAETARKGRSAWHEAQSRLLAAESALHRGQSADEHLRRAEFLVRANGYTSMQWKPKALRCVAAGGSSLPAYRAAFKSLLEARLLTSSQIARSAYLRDKGEFISAYLAALLSKPTPARVREAVEVVGQSRSAALIDEILTSSAVQLDPEQVRTLEDIRSELNVLEADSQRPNGARRGAIATSHVATLQRRWIEATHALLDRVTTSPVSNRPAAIVVQGGEKMFALEAGRAIPLSADSSSIQRTIKWAKFEMLAPMADKTANAECALELAHDLGSTLLAPWISPEAATIAICPEDNLWRVPWTVCLSSVSNDAEVVLSLHPSLVGVADFRPKPDSKVVLWVNRAKDLYHAATEEASLLQRFPDAHVCRTAAEARESLKGNVDLLHVIGHGKHNEANPMFSSLQFEDGSIYAAEIAKSSIRPNFVALSACETGSLSAAFRAEPDGFARAFLARGAKSVIGSLWPLDDEAASLAYERFYDRLSAGDSVVTSLRTARKAVRDWNPHPYFWGSLVLFGGNE